MGAVELAAAVLATGAAPGLTGSAGGAVHDLNTVLREAACRRPVGADGGACAGAAPYACWMRARRTPTCGAPGCSTS